jgi:hypothetical protein
MTIRQHERPAMLTATLFVRSQLQEQLSTTMSSAAVQAATHLSQPNILCAVGGKAYEMHEVGICQAADVQAWLQLLEHLQACAGTNRDQAQMHP